MGSGTRLRAGLAVAGTAALLLLPSTQGAPGRTSYSSVQAACANASAKMLCYHRQTRRQAGLRTLSRNLRLDRAARLKERRIIRCHRITHQPCGDSFDRQFGLAGYLPWPGSWIVGENLAWGYGTPWEAFQGLMHSPTHRANILRRSFRELGVAQSGSPWGPLWVLEYGHRW
jgi:uncharacterized protein YkwD